MKKVLAVLLMLAVVSAVFAGGGKDAGAAKGSSVVRVGFAQCKADESDWRIANTKSMQSTFNVPGYQFTMADSNNDAAKQIADVQGFIDQEYDYIVIAAVNMDGWDTVLRNAKNAKHAETATVANVLPAVQTVISVHAADVNVTIATARIARNVNAPSVTVVLVSAQIAIA